MQSFTKRLLLCLPLAILASCASAPPAVVFHCPRPTPAKLPALETQPPTVQSDQEKIFQELF